MNSKISILVFALIFSNLAYAGERIHSPSFDCETKGLNKIEHMICESEELSQKDFLLNQLYSIALEKTANSNNLKEKQRNWIRHVRSQCSNLECLKRVYEHQEIFLGSIAVSDGKLEYNEERGGEEYTYYLWKTNDNKSLVNEMNELIFIWKSKNKNINVISCENVWENHVARNHGWGGFCWATINGKLDKYMMCSNLASSDISAVLEHNEYLLVRHLRKNCYGG